LDRIELSGDLSQSSRERHFEISVAGRTRKFLVLLNYIPRQKKTRLTTSKLAPSVVLSNAIQKLLASVASQTAQVSELPNVTSDVTTLAMEWESRIDCIQLQ
jgi:hypothetical protein